MEAPDAAFSAPVSKGARLVLVRLYKYARDYRCTAWPSQRVLADLTGQNERSVRRQLGELEALGWIERESVKPGGQIEWRLRSDLHDGSSPPDRSAPPPGSSMRLHPLHEDQREEQRETTTDGTAVVVPISPISDGSLTTAQRRKLAATAVWDAHERQCVERGIGRHALGGEGQLRKPQDTDIAAIIRCARTLMKQEGIQERTAWLILRDAAVAVVDEAADAKEEGDDFAHKLITWRRRDPFGGKKLGPMLDALQRRRGRDPNDPGATGAPATTGPNRRSDEERAELARRVAEEKARAAGGSKTSK